MNMIWVWISVVAVIVYVTVFSCIFFWRSIKRRFLMVFRRKSYIEAVIFNENKQIDFVPTTLDGRKFKFKKGMYNVNDKCIRYVKSKPYIFYFKDNPNPLQLDQSYVKKGEFEIDSSTQRDIIGNKIVRDIVAENKDLTFIKIVVIIIGLMLLGYILYSTGVFDQVVGDIVVKSPPNVIR